MEQLNGGNILDTEGYYNNQITTIVRGFMQVWNRFEATLGKELSEIQEDLQEMHPERGNQPNTNFELFYRACSGIYPEGHITMGEFSNALSVPLSTATRIADWLVENGFINRLPDSEDRRIVRVGLTDNGRQLYESIDKYIRQRVQQVLSGLTDEERAILITLVGKLLNAPKQSAD
jgi:DNA-binding MarR family transcriptional regulator